MPLPVHRDGSRDRGVTREGRKPPKPTASPRDRLGFPGGLAALFCVAKDNPGIMQPCRGRVTEDGVDADDAAVDAVVVLSDEAGLLSVISYAD